MMDFSSFKEELFYVLVYLITVPLVSGYGCPKECQCKTLKNEVSAKCFFDKLDSNTTSYNFSVLPTQSLTTLWITCKRTGLLKSTLPPRMFEHLNKLNVLWIAYCRFEHLGEQVFSGLNSLINLNIIGAVNISIDSKAFLQVPNLKVLRIVDSGWRGSPSNKLCVLSKVEELNLSGNKITDISGVYNFCPQKQFIFNKLTHLDLSQNRLHVLKSDFSQKFINLEKLFIQNNEMREIQNGALNSLSRLKVLNISDNYFAEFPDGFLSGSSRLVSLDLSNNHLIKLPPYIKELKQLIYLYAKNTLVTDISLLENTTITVLKIQNSSVSTLPPNFCKKGEFSPQQIYLKQNNISKLPLGLLKDCIYLKILDLSKNNISILPDNFFDGSKNITQLYLSENNISNSSKDIFNNLSILTRLNLSVNSFAEIPLIPANLGEFYISQNLIHSIPQEAFSHRQHFNLMYLIMKNNRITNIEDSAFQFLYNLQILNLKNNNLTKLNKLTFKNLRNLIGLSIDYNSIPDIYTALRPLKKLKYLFAKNNLITELKPGTFPKEISKIDLSYNKIKIIESRTFENLINLKEVNLKGNKLKTLNMQSVRIGRKNVISNFYISGNDFQCDCNLEWLKGNSFQKAFASSYYPVFQDFDTVMCFQRGKKWLPVGLIHKMNRSEFLCEYERSSFLKLPFSCGVLCPCCLQQTCYCQDTCPEQCHCTLTYNHDHNNVKCAGGNLTEATGIPSNATMIDLSANDLGSLTDQSFVRQNNAEILYLNNSKITGIGKKTFITFSALKILHLEYNEIRMLGYESLLGLNQLKELILNHNAIERILPGTFNMTPNLEVLDLSFNNLRKIDSQILNLNNAKKIFLFGNPWSCDCQDIEPLRELLLNRSSEIDSKTILCNETQVPVLQYDIDFCRNISFNSTLKSLPVEQTKLIHALSIGLSLIVFVFMASIILVLYRKEIQIIVFIRFGWRILAKKNILDDENKKYDAFVSYHNSQDEFVVTKLLPQLEDTDPGFKLCVHFRDFPVGAPIVDNISESIENSKRTILLLTDEFLQSEWCRYEFQAAHLEALSNKTNRLILVLLKDINMDLVDGGLKHYMKTKTYLKYDDPRFWDKLRFALPEKKKCEKTANEEKKVDENKDNCIQINLNLLNP